MHGAKEKLHVFDVVQLQLQRRLYKFMDIFCCTVLSISYCYRILKAIWFLNKSVTVKKETLENLLASECFEN